MNKNILIVFLIIIMGGFLGAGERLSVEGYFKSFAVGFRVPDVYVGGEAFREPVFGAVSNRLRLKLGYGVGSDIRFRVAYDFSPTFRDAGKFAGGMFFGGMSAPAYRVDDFAERLYPGVGREVGDFQVYHNLDRFYFAFKLPGADLFVGRQAIAWGSGHVVNPTDILAPFTFNELDVEERRGVDAVRLRVPLGMLAELDMGVVFGERFRFSRGALYVRGKTVWGTTDVSALVMKFRGNLLVGADVTRSIGGAGFWCEAAYVWGGVFDGDEEYLTGPCFGAVGEGGEDYFRLVTGLDYNFGGKLYGFFEYHLNTAGGVEPVDYVGAVDGVAYRDGAVYLMGRHYLNVGATYSLTPLIPVTGLVMVNLGDGSFTFSPKVEYNIKEDIYLALGAYIEVGKRPGGGGMRSEFGSYPTMFFSSFRIYF